VYSQLHKSLSNDGNYLDFIQFHTAQPIPEFTDAISWRCGVKRNSYPSCNVVHLRQ